LAAAKDAGGVRKRMTRAMVDSHAAIRKNRYRPVNGRIVMRIVAASGGDAPLKKK
jgi:hypothetical protein